MSNTALVRLRITLYTFWALLNAWVTGMTDVVWSSLRWEQQSCLVAGVLMSWVGMMVAYFDKSAWRLDEERKNGKPPPPAA